MLDVVSLRSPFLTADEAAFFLQVSVDIARSRFDHGQLPAAHRLDGGLFQPTRSSRLIPFVEFRSLVDGEARELLDLWQDGAFEVPAPPSTGAEPIDFATARRSLTASVVASDEAGEA